MSSQPGETGKRLAAGEAASEKCTNPLACIPHFRNFLQGSKKR
jgi:hypothetical protein